MPPRGSPVHSHTLPAMSCRRCLRLRRSALASSAARDDRPVSRRYKWGSSGGSSRSPPATVGSGFPLLVALSVRHDTPRYRRRGCRNWRSADLSRLEPAAQADGDELLPRTPDADRVRAARHGGSRSLGCSATLKARWTSSACPPTASWSLVRRWKFDGAAAPPCLSICKYYGDGGLAISIINASRQYLITLRILARKSPPLLMGK